MALTEIPPEGKEGGRPPFFLLLGQTLIRIEPPEPHLRGLQRPNGGGRLSP